MNNYRVGQVLYMIGEKSTKVLPIQVVEEIIRTTMDGKAKSYIIRLPDKKKTTADISEIKGHLFENTTELREYMTKNATDAINKMIDHASALRDSVFEYVVQDNDRSHLLTTEPVVVDQLSMFPSLSNTQLDPMQGYNEMKPNDTIKVDLGNGKFATMDTSSLEKLGDK